MDFQYSAGDQSFTVRVEPGDAGCTVTLNGRTYTVTATATAGRPGELALRVDGRSLLAHVAADGPRRWVALPGQASAPVSLTVPQASGRGRPGSGAQAGALEAQMPGVVRRVLVAPGEAVERGQVLVVLEAMKMEIRVTAPDAGVVRQLGVTEGQAVERGQVLLSFERKA